MKKLCVFAFVVLATIFGISSAAFATDTDGHKEPMPTVPPTTVTTAAPVTTTTNAPKSILGVPVTVPKPKPKPKVPTPVKKSAPAAVPTTTVPPVTTSTTEAPVINQSTVDCPPSATKVVKGSCNCWPWWWLLVAAGIGAIVRHLLGKGPVGRFFSRIGDKIKGALLIALVALGGWKVVAVLAIVAVVAFWVSLIAGFVVLVAIAAWGVYSHMRRNNA